MKLLLGVVWLLLFPHLAIAQNNLVQDNFEDNDLSQNPIWIGNISEFANTGGILKSNSDSVNHAFFITTQINFNKENEWTLDVNIPIATSSANYVDVVLGSDSANLLSKYNGHFLRIGGTSDNFSLFRNEAGSPILLANGANGHSNNFNGQIKIVRDSLGNWLVSYDNGFSGNFVFLTSVSSIFFSDSKYCGIIVRQSTTSFHKKHSFDNFYFGQPRVDKTPPKVEFLNVLSDSSLVVLFSETIDNTKITATNFEINNGIGLATTVNFVKNSCTLHFPNHFATQNYQLHITDIFDLAGNKLSDTTLNFNYLKPDDAELFDVVISEVMSDPTPSVGLPEFEYLELYNRSAKILNLKDWILADASKEILLPDLIMMPNTFLVICDLSAYEEMKQFAPLLTSSNFISLNNSGDSITLKNNKNEIIFQLNYSNDWHTLEWKKAGGWSLEMIDPTMPCLGAENWNSSKDLSGGTPGKINSISGNISDSKAPAIINSFIELPNKIKLTFDESLILYAPNASHFLVENYSISKVEKTDNYHLTLTFNQFFSYGKLYELLVNGVSDCSGNKIENAKISLALPSKIKPNNLLINEILFNPKTGGVDFVEIYNAADSVFDLSHLFIGKKNMDGDWENLEQVSTLPKLIFPKEYIALTSNPLIINQHYPKSSLINLFETPSLPTMPDDEGNVGISISNGTSIDWLPYSEDMHNSLISNNEGVSLERRSVLDSTNQKLNWTSASYVENYATPGYKNSQSALPLLGLSEFEISPDPFSPDGDGFNDELFIKFNIQESANINIRVFDLNGKMVAFPVNTALSGINNIFVWSGKGVNDEVVPPGIYVVVLEALSVDSGKKIIKKQAITVAY
ncbi:MAG: lamin tail domain-containing protein [Flavobacteriales bacterium]|nr:lamin tail domain-containing protein [Flavobacteriales bacterium]